MRKKVGEYRQRKKGLSVETIVQPNSPPPDITPEIGFNTKSAEYKAVGKLKRALPSTSAKKKEAVSKLLQTFNEKDREDIINMVANTTAKAKPTRAISSNLIESVKSFYERDDISRMSPDMRNCRKFVNPVTGVKEEKQIRHLMYKVMDVYNMFLLHVQNGKFG